MDGDGDILGMQRRPEVVEPTVPAATSAPATAAAAATSPAGAAARHATGANPLKRQRSVGGGALARVESEVSDICQNGVHGSKIVAQSKTLPRLPPHHRPSLPTPFCPLVKADEILAKLSLYDYN